MAILLEPPSLNQIAVASGKPLRVAFMELWYYVV